LWFSLLIYPLSTARAQALTLQAARALSQVLARKTGVAVSVKLPNDLYCGRRKLAGILLEVRGETAVLGVGVNVNCRTDNLPFPAVSVREVSGARQGRCLILAEFLEQLRLHAGLEA
jgi:BirA family biotin operon repressor/biotin-[acetyl-CoA-carboxylase] ligase